VADKLNQQSWPGISNGDADVWREFLNGQIPQLYRMFLNHWPNPSLAEELAQKTVFDAVRARTSYQPTKGSPQEWIFGIARNNIRLEIRKRASRLCHGVNLSMPVFSPKNTLFGLFPLFLCSGFFKQLHNVCVSLHFRYL
jgi:DNA-directed RNA polymerase specialized sigma24 family protein